MLMKNYKRMLEDCKRMFAATVLLFIATTVALCADIRGRVVDKTSNEALIGATVQLADGRGVVTDIDGNFVINGLDRKKRYRLTV